MMAKPKEKYNSINKWKDVKNIVIHVEKIKCNVDANPEVYSEDEISRIRDIVTYMAKNVWIDRTYVCYKGNRFKDAFIKEDGWNDLIEMIKSTSFSKEKKKLTKIEIKTNNEIMETILTIAMVYLYNIVEKFGYSVENVSIEFPPNTKFTSSYYIDNRKTWNC